MVNRRALSGLFLAAMLLPFPAVAGPPSPPAVAPAPAAAGGSFLQQGRAHQAVGSYDEAATAYETFARQSPNASDASAALSDAIVLRLGMGQGDEATKDAELFVKNYGATQHAQAEKIVLGIARYHLEHEDWSTAKLRYEGWVKAFDAGAPLDERIVAHAGLGRVFVMLNKSDKAAVEYRVVLDLWHDPAAAVRTLGAADDGDRRLARALTAEGEALFFFADQKRKELDAIRFPEYRGPGTREDVLKHVNTKVVAWVKTKRPAIEGVEKEYRKIVELQPVPPPRWVIASASRVGQMWGKFVAEFRAAPIPKEWKGHGIVPGTSDLTYDELRKEWYEKLDEATQPNKQTAKGAFKICLDYSVKFQYFDAYSRACELWLAKHYGAEYHLMDEFRPRAHLLGPAMPPPDPLPDPR